MKEKRQARVVALLILVIIVLIAIMAYAFVIQPAIDNFILKKQTEAVEGTLSFMLAQIDAQGITQITTPEGPRYLMEVDPEQLQQPA